MIAYTIIAQPKKNMKKKYETVRCLSLAGEGWKILGGRGRKVFRGNGG